MKNLKILILFFIVLLSCNKNEIKEYAIADEISKMTSIEGKKGNGDYLYITSGSKLYSIGNQKGNFPEVGFHVEGEMGGIWSHPIKLLDGFNVEILDKDFSARLTKCNKFVAYPLASQFQYSVNQLGLKVIRTDFVPDHSATMVVEYKIINTTASTKNFSFKLNIDSDLRPVWLGEQNGMKDGKDNVYRFDKKTNTLILKDSLSPWFAGIALEGKNVSFLGNEKSKLKGNGTTVSLQKTIVLEGNKTQIVRFYISGSIHNPEQTIAELNTTEKNLKKLIKQKIARYKEIDNTATIKIPDTKLEEAYKWGKYNTDWLVRDIEGLGRGLSAGMPDYPWFFSNDQASSFEAIVGTRDPKIFYESWDMIKKASDKFNSNSGRIIHEMSTNGVVSDKGRMEESQGFINAAWEIFLWTGNIDFLKTYYVHGEKVWKFLQENDKNNNLYVEGNGGVEIQGLNDEMLDVAVGTQKFLLTMSEMSNVFGEKEKSLEFKQKADLLQKKINEDWWIPSEKRYGDFIADNDKVVKLIDAAIKERTFADRNQWAIKKLNSLKEKVIKGEYNDKSYCVFYNGGGILPLVAGIADDEKARQMLESVGFFTNKFGLYIAGIARPDDITLEEKSIAYKLNHKFNYNEAVMPSGTSKMIYAECKYGTPDSAMKYINKLMETYSYATPGTTYEISPDYGMFLQAWNIGGINTPLIHYFFGVHPNAYYKTVNLKPNFPKKWGYAQLKNILIGNNKLSIDYKKDNQNRCTYTIKSQKKNWKILFEVPKNAKDTELNGVIIKSSTIEFKGLENTLTFTL